MKIASVADVKAHLSSYLKASATGPVVVTRNGKAVAVLLGHTLDDQAETVLLGLGRGSGPRSLAGMRPVDGGYRRPFLGVSRSTPAAACAECPALRAIPRICAQ